MNKKYKILICVLVSIILIVLCITIFNVFVRKNKKVKNAEEQIVSSYNNPIIPEGFKKVETDTASWEIENGVPIGWNNGLVIEDEQGNQFVWIPVDINNTNIYSKDKLNIDNEEEKQILKYGGFYVGRYEAGIPSEQIDISSNVDEQVYKYDGKPVSKKGSIPWNYISIEKAKNISKTMYEGNVQSTLIHRKQMKCILNWIEQSGYNIKSSKDWGNYSVSYFSFTGLYSEDLGKSFKYGENISKGKYNILLSTGISEHNKSNNIYDVAGNIREYIYQDNQYCDSYGGYFDFIDQGASATFNYGEPTYQTGFRVALNMK